jgi:ATP-binding cassette subfamily F protein 3
MSVISVSKLNKNYGISPILTDVSFHVNEGDKIGIVGANGAGKSTLMKILDGELLPDGGDIYLSKSVEIGYLKQQDMFPGGGTVREEVLGKKGEFRIPEGADPEKWGISMLEKLGFDEEHLAKNVGLLSGGERTRLALALMLLKNPDVLMLDEPTNHLDIASLKWLEQHLKNYKGTLLVISHDRYFLDKITSRIFEIENHKLTAYEGNYSAYVEKKRKNYEVQLRHYEKQQREIKRQKDMIAVMKGHNTEHLVKRAQSREKRLAMIEEEEKPELFDAKIKLSFKEAISTGNDVIFAEGLSKSFGTRKLFSGVDLDIKKNDRICIVGENGIGKTTLLKILLGMEDADSGYLRLGQNVRPAYYDQQQEFLHPDKSVLDELHSKYIKYDQTELRSLLGRFLFKGDDVFKLVGDLSGGEKARLSLLELMMTGANVLIMDEPTNHLDINAMEVIEDALLAFEGTLVIVSHDRYLLKKLPTAIYELGENGITAFLGNYDYYEEKSAEAHPTKYSIGSGRVKQAVSKQERIAQREAEKAAALAQRKAEKAKAKLEEEIAEAEAKVAEIEQMLCDPAIFGDSAKTMELSDALEKAKELVDTKYAEWYNY